MPTATHNISIAQGESLHEIVFAIVDPSGVAVDLTGYTARLDMWTASVDPTHADSSLVRRLLSTGPSAQLSVVGSTVSLTTTSGQSAFWAAAELEYTLWVIDGSARAQVVAQGRFTIRKR